MLTTARKWWFASTAIPLLAATIGPLCNVLSIAALVSPWRLTLPNNGELPDGTDDNGVGIEDPRWCVETHSASTSGLANHALRTKGRLLSTPCLWSAGF